MQCQQKPFPGHRNQKEKDPMKTRVIGDCYKLGKIGEAVREGFFAASSLD